MINILASSALSALLDSLLIFLICMVTSLPISLAYRMYLVIRYPKKGSQADIETAKKIRSRKNLHMFLLTLFIALCATITVFIVYIVKT